LLAESRVAGIPTPRTRAAVVSLEASQPERAVPDLAEAAVS